MASCIKDEALNKECDIESAWIEGTEYENYFYQTTEMRKEKISSAETDIVFSVRSLLSLSTQIPLNFKITDGATIEPASGSMQDFTKGSVAYTVTSQDGEWKRTYNVTFQESPLPAEKYNFEHVETQTEKTMLGGTNEMHIFYEQTANGPTYCWATGNSGSALTKNGSKPEEFPVYSTPDGKVGRGVCLNTQSAGVLGEWTKKPIAAGNFFLGSFDSRFALTNTLKTTNMGIVYTKEPVRVTGYYKYQPGEVFTDKDFHEVSTRIDEPTIHAALYLNHDEQGNTVMLHGDDVRTSPYIVRRAEVASMPPTSEWRRFEMTFEGTTPIDAELLANRGYNLSLVFSSSKTGDTFEGAVGSTLYIDKVEITFKNEE
jgi:hypothetical protein